MSKTYQYLTSNRMEMKFELPLAEVVYEFYDRLKSVTQGYGSFDYEIAGYQETDLVKLDFLINGERVDALSILIHRDKPKQGPEPPVKNCGRKFPGNSSKFPSREPSAAKLFPGKPFPPSARM